ncbi:MAG: TAXI family TRAP transporter solute-binding subunit [Defluviitaleaceae bacterium]|nr:TAXI family TRAP transporter solute-binding subunit [Defluviitaleaceae bacterium]
MKKSLSVVIAAAMALVMTACATPGGGGGGAQLEHLIMATGGAAGTYYPFGGVIAAVVTSNVETVNITANTSGASVANARALNSGDVELALMQNDVLYYAFNGIEIMATDDPMTELRVIASLYPEVVQLVATQSSGITSVGDLRGMRVVIGDAGSGTEANAMHVLGAHGITLADISHQNLSFGEASTAMQNGNVDAAFVTAGAATPAIVELNANMDVVIVPIEGAPVASMKAEFPFYMEYVITDDVYGIPGATTVAVLATLVTTTALSDDTVYAITRAIFENQPDIALGHARGHELSPESALYGLSVPLHPGAERFFRAEGYLN